MTELIVRREHSALVDRMRQYSVLVDGRVAATLANGSSASIPISPGPHQVQLKIDWCRSPKVSIQVTAGQSFYLDCGPNASPLLGLIYITFLSGQYLWLRPATQPDHVP